MSTWVGIDVGGTFTDVIVYTNDGAESTTVKVPSTPSDPGKALIAGLEAGLQKAGSTPREVTSLVHGSTVGTNAILEQAGARIGIITTAGFEDSLYIGRAKRTEMYDLMIDPETPYFLCPRHRIRGIPGRLSKTGDIVEDIDPQAVRSAVRELVEEEHIESLAINLLFSFVSPRQELQVAQIVQAEYPDLYVSLSSQVDPRAREYERLVVTAMDAYIRPKMSTYIGQLQKRLDDLDVSARLQVMESHGGIVDSSTIRQRAVGTLLSGLAGGAIGAGAVGQVAGRGQILAFDMGGTSTDVTLIDNGQPLVSDEGAVGAHRVRVPMVDVHTIGAGGGSIALVDSAGSLRVGPQSAGAVPGPAAYANGGGNATVTDANIVLGYLGAAGLAGGTLTLDKDLAHKAVKEEIADRLGIPVEQAAWGIHRIAVAGMASAARVVSVSRGHDARRFTLLACGGAGPMHACGVADDLGIDEILIPPYPGVLSAYGLLAADAEMPQWKTFHTDLSEQGITRLRAELGRVGEEVTARMANAGVPVGDIYINGAVDARYRGQSHELTVHVNVTDSDSAIASAIREGFESQHQNLYGQTDPNGLVEITGLKVTAVAKRTTPSPQAPVTDGRTFSPQKMYDPTTKSMVPAAIMHRGSLTGTLAGPAIILQDDTTTVVQRGWTAHADPSGSLFISRDKAGADAE